MAKKKLLSEAQVKRFMGLAGIQPLNEMGDYNYKRDEPMQEEMEPEMEEMEPEMDEMEPEMEEMEPEMEEKAELEGPVGGSEAKEEMAADVIKAVAGALGLDIDIDMEDGEAEPEMDEMEPEMDEMEPEMDEKDAEEEDVMKEMSEVNLALTEDEIVNEVARRVAKRVVEAKRAHKKMNEALGRNTKNKRFSTRKK